MGVKCRGFLRPMLSAAYSVFRELLLLKGAF
jgi:hypothetical protein